MIKNSEVLIQEFVASVNRLAEDLKAAVIAEVQQAFLSVASEREVGSVRRGKPGPKPKAAAMSKSKSKSGRRDSAAIDQQAATVLAWLKKNPDSRSEMIAAGTGIATSELVLPIKKLLASKALAKPKGQRRGTTYAAR